MNRQEKIVAVEALNSSLNDAPLVILTGFIGSTVAEMDSLRRACEPVGAQFHVVKNTLAKRALVGTGKEELAEFFKGNIGVLIAGEDAIGAAKIFKEQAKTNKKLEARVGFFEGDLLDAGGVDAVASLPSREELLATMLNTLLEAPRQVLRVMQAPARDLLYLLKNFEDKLEKDG